MQVLYVTLQEFFEEFLQLGLGSMICGLRVRIWGFMLRITFADD